MVFGLLCAFEEMEPWYDGMIMIMHLECTNYCTNLSRTHSYQKSESEFTIRFGAPISFQDERDSTA
jgi:hypothetical protein